MSSKKEKGKDLVVKNEYAVSNAGMFEGMGLGAGEEIDTIDILIPALMLTQGLTKAVAKGKAKVGRYVNSTDLTDLGDSVEVIVLDSMKLWQEYRVVVNGKDEYLATIEYYGNEQLPYQYKNEKGEDCTRKQVLKFYILLLSEIKDAVAFPYTVSFKGANKKAGRELSTHFAKLRSVSLPSFSKVFTLGTELVEDEHTYYVKTVDMGRDITKDEFSAVKGWLSELKKNKDNIRLDDTEEREDFEGKTVETEVINETANGTQF